MKTAVFAALAAGTALAGPALAERAGAADGTVKVGVLVDMSGAYSAHGGPGVVEAVKMAAEDFGGTVGDRPIEVLDADYQLKIDIGLSTANRWLDTQGVDAIIESTDSATAIGLFDLSREKDFVALGVGSASTELTNGHCSPNAVHYVYDTWALAAGTGAAMVAEGGDSWYFLTADYAFGHSLEENTSKFVEAAGGEVLGALRAPLGTSDFSSFLLQAQASGAKVVGLANAGTDFVTAVKQAGEFGLVAMGQKLGGMLVFINNVKALGLETAEGLTFTVGYYWDRNDETRAFAERFFERTDQYPSMVQAGAYSATMHYLHAVEATGSEDAADAVAWMKSNPVNDFFAENGTIRADGRMVYDNYLVAAKAPSESSGDWDLMKVLRTIPGEEVVMPLEQSSCDLVTGSTQ
ncbi:ABC transporter substrate-binding protein [Mangrovicoccus ximenensis]|uniref:ABC transporter substrate-binding protein n=1 Tax=Mangrovicoccus ximenensis TaxID=1911570 RepID=UPI00191BDB53|nr:ABC transporter substrate-binding protein [Mangrovicoccus ximenensis]